jgi:hypothetical protein
MRLSAFLMQGVCWRKTAIPSSSSAPQDFRQLQYLLGRSRYVLDAVQQSMQNIKTTIYRSYKSGM